MGRGWTSGLSAAGRDRCVSSLDCPGLNPSPLKDLKNLSKFAKVYSCGFSHKLGVSYTKQAKLNNVATKMCTVRIQCCKLCTQKWAVIFIHLTCATQ